MKLCTTDVKVNHLPCPERTFLAVFLAVPRKEKCVRTWSHLHLASPEPLSRHQFQVFFLDLWCHRINFINSNTKETSCTAMLPKEQIIYYHSLEVILHNNNWYYLICVQEVPYVAVQPPQLAWSGGTRHGMEQVPVQVRRLSKSPAELAWLGSFGPAQGTPVHKVKTLINTQLSTQQHYYRNY